MKDWQRGVGVAIAALMLLSALSLLTANYDEISCGEGTVEVDGVCELLFRAPREGEVDVYIDFLADNYTVTKGDSVRLIFDESNYDHYIPETFVMEDFGISVDLEDRRFQMYEFEASEPGVYEYSSEGLCRVLIPGAGEVEVDCAIYCGETENGRTGTITILED